MVQVDVDPRELKRFAARLQVTIQQMGDNKKNVASRFADLENHWKDKQHAKFAREFQDMMARLESFFAESERLIQFLSEKAKPGEEYSDIRF